MLQYQEQLEKKRKAPGVREERQKNRDAPAKSSTNRYNSFHIYVHNTFDIESATWKVHS